MSVCITSFPSSCMRIVAVDMTRAGLECICDALVHPECPQRLVTLYLSGHSACSPTVDLPCLDITAEFLAAGSLLREALTHPQGPKYLSAISYDQGRFFHPALRGRHPRYQDSVNSALRMHMLSMKHLKPPRAKGFESRFESARYRLKAQLSPSFQEEAHEPPRKAKCH